MDHLACTMKPYCSLQSRLPMVPLLRWLLYPTVDLTIFTPHSSQCGHPALLPLDLQFYKVHKNCWVVSQLLILWMRFNLTINCDRVEDLSYAWNTTTQNKIQPVLSWICLRDYASECQLKELDNIAYNLWLKELFHHYLYILNFDCPVWVWQYSTNTRKFLITGGISNELNDLGFKIETSHDTIGLIKFQTVIVCYMCININFLFLY